MPIKSPVVRVQRSGDRYFADHGWLRTYHTFSFAQYFDPHNVNWGALRVLNDDWIAPGRGFGTHPHEDMEIITYVLEGRLEHKDSMGNHGIVGPGSVQYMSAGTGVAHSEFNHSAEHALRLVQMWVLPASPGLSPSYGQMEFRTEQRLNQWLTVVSGQPNVEAPIRFSQDATFFVSKLQVSSLSHLFGPDRYGFLFVADGSVAANNEKLNSGDAMRVHGLDELTVEGSAEILLWDVPPAHSDR